MAVKIRLARRGRKKNAMYDVVVADARAPRDGKFIEKIGRYNPNTNPASIDLNEERAFYWVMTGAQPTDTTRAILSYRGIMYKKHLQIGVNKGAITQEDADKKFDKWLADKEASIQAKRDKLATVAATSASERKAAESKVKEARAEAIKKKNIVVEEAPTEEAPAAETTEEVATETVTEAPAEEASKAEVKEEKAPETKEEAAPVKEEAKAEPKEEAPKTEAKEEVKAEEAPVKEEAKAEETTEAKAETKEEAPKAEAKEDAPAEEDKKEG